MSWSEIKKAVNQNLDIPLSDIINMDDLALFGDKSSVYNNGRLMEELFYSNTVPNHMMINQYVFDYGVSNNLHLGSFFKRIFGMNQSIDWDSLDTLKKLCNNEDAMQDVINNRVALDLVNNSSSLQNTIVSSDDKNVISKFCNNDIFLNNTFSSNERLNILANNPVALGAFMNDEVSGKILRENNNVYGLVWLTNDDPDIILKTAVELIGMDSRVYNTYEDIIDAGLSEKIMAYEYSGYLYDNQYFRNLISTNETMLYELTDGNSSNTTISKFISSTLGNDANEYKYTHQILSLTQLFTNEIITNVITKSRKFMTKIFDSSKCITNIINNYSKCVDKIVSSDASLSVLANNEWALNQILSNTNCLQVIMNNDHALEYLLSNEISYNYMHKDVNDTSRNYIIGYLICKKINISYTSLYGLLLSYYSNVFSNEDAKEILLKVPILLSNQLNAIYEAYLKNTSSYSNYDTALRNLLYSNTNFREFVQRNNDFYIRVLDTMRMELRGYFICGKYGATACWNRAQYIITNQYDGTNYGYNVLLDNDSFVKDITDSYGLMEDICQDYTAAYYVMYKTKSFNAIEAKPSLIEKMYASTGYFPRYYISKKCNVAFSTSSSYAEMSNFISNYGSNIFNNTTYFNIAIKFDYFIRYSIQSYHSNMISNYGSKTVPIICNNKKVVDKYMTSNLCEYFTSTYNTYRTYMAYNDYTLNYTLNNTTCLGSYISSVYANGSRAYSSYSDFLTNIGATNIANNSTIMNVIYKSLIGMIGFCSQISGQGVTISTSILDNSTKTEAIFSNLTSFNAIDNSQVMKNEIYKHEVAMTKYLAKIIGVNLSSYNSLKSLFDDNIEDLLNNSTALNAINNSDISKNILLTYDNLATKYITKIAKMSFSDYNTITDLSISDINKILSNETSRNLFHRYIKTLDNNDLYAIKTILSYLNIDQTNIDNIDSGLSLLTSDVLLSINEKEHSTVFDLISNQYNKNSILTKIIGRLYLDNDNVDIYDIVTYYVENKDIKLPLIAAKLISYSLNNIGSALFENDYIYMFDGRNLLALECTLYKYALDGGIYNTVEDIHMYYDKDTNVQSYAATNSGLSIAAIDKIPLDFVTTNTWTLTMLSKNYTHENTIKVLKNIASNLNYVRNVYDTVTSNSKSFSLYTTNQQDGVSNLNTNCTLSNAGNCIVLCCLGTYSSTSAYTNLLVNGVTIANSSSYTRPSSVSRSNVNAIGVTNCTFTETNDGYAAISVYKCLE